MEFSARWLSFSAWLLVFVLYTTDCSVIRECSTKGEFDQNYTFTITENNPCVMKYEYKLNSTNSSQAFRIFVSSYHTNSMYPVLFVVKQQLGILSWQIPLSFDPLHKYYVVHRTLCPIRNYIYAQAGDEQEVILDISTSSYIPVSVDLNLMIENDFLLRYNSPYDLQVSPSEPQYYEAEFPAGVDILVVSFESSDDVCALVSIQHIGCPVYDLEKNVQFTGVYQTMTKKAAITIQAKDYEFRKFYVVVVVKSSDYDCTGLGAIETPPIANRTKQLRVHIYEKMTQQEYFLATLGATSIFVVFYIFFGIIAIIYLVKSFESDANLTEMPPMEIDRQRNASYGSISNNGSQSFLTDNQRQTINSANNSNSSTLFSNNDEVNNDDDDDDDEDEDDGKADFDTLPDADSERDVFLTKKYLYVADLARKKCRSLEKKSKLYLCNMVIVAVFYALPVVQLVVTYESVQHVTGNQDICYYNFLCVYPLGPISDFNHVFSNLGYVLLGFLFIGLVMRRDLLHKQKIAMNDEYEKSFGIPRHFGLFYAMGLALVMEGVLSGCYHICPNYSNFQFDTSFMYMIACICMLKIYQTRHPDINANAYASFLAFAFILILGVTGVLYGTQIFWIVFAVVYILACLALSAQIYYMGRWKLNLGIFKRMYLNIKTDFLSEPHCFHPLYLDRFFLLAFVNAVNWSFAIFGVIQRPKDFASYMLAIFIVNLLMYVAFYIIMKIRSREKILRLPLLYITLSIITWTASLYFFYQRSTSWKLMPAQSRTYNKPCILFNFYDDHDVWHFLSAASMFFSFMILLTLDDDLVQTARTSIPVF